MRSLTRTLNAQSSPTYLVLQVNLWLIGLLLLQSVAMTLPYDAKHDKHARANDALSGISHKEIPERACASRSFTVTEGAKSEMVFCSTLWLTSGEDSHLNVYLPVLNMYTDLCLFIICSPSQLELLGNHTVSRGFQNDSFTMLFKKRCSAAVKNILFCWSQTFTFIDLWQTSCILNVIKFSIFIEQKQNI